MPRLTRQLLVLAPLIRHAAAEIDHALEYKRAYAQLATAAGLSKDQVVRIYAFEAGGTP